MITHVSVESECHLRVAGLCAACDQYVVAVGVGRDPVHQQHLGVEQLQRLPQLTTGHTRQRG